MCFEFDASPPDLPPDPEASRDAWNRVLDFLGEPPA
jgi:hypothetical protein